MLDAESSHAGHWLLNAWRWMLYVGCWVLDPLPDGPPAVTARRSVAGCAARASPELKPHCFGRHIFGASLRPDRVHLSASDTARGAEGSTTLVS